MLALWYQSLQPQLVAIAITVLTAQLRGEVLAHITAESTKACLLTQTRVLLHIIETTDLDQHHRLDLLAVPDWDLHQLGVILLIQSVLALDYAANQLLKNTLLR